MLQEKGEMKGRWYPSTSRPLGGSQLDACPCPDALRSANKPLHTQSGHHVGCEHRWFQKLDDLGLTFKVQLLKVGLPDVELNP